MNTAKIALIAALSENRVIGKDNKLPWHISEDLKRFKALTNGHPVIMGRKTYESIGRLLPGRANIIITRNTEFIIDQATIAHSLESAIELAKIQIGGDKVFIIGGGKVFSEAIAMADILYLTIVHTSIEGDAYFPDYSEFKKIVFQQKGESNGYHFTFLDLEK